MIIHFNGMGKNFFSALPTIPARFKPIAYAVIFAISALAAGILIFQFKGQWSLSSLSKRIWSAHPPSGGVNSTDTLGKLSLKKGLHDQEKPILEVGKTASSLRLRPQEPVTFDRLVENSQNFAKSIPFPTTHNRMEKFAVNGQLQAEVVEHAQATRPLLHARIWDFIPKFLDYKKMHGSSIEQKIYADMTQEQFVDRLIKKRSLVFYTAGDSYLLRDGTQGGGRFERIGRDDEVGPLVLENYQSYFEMSLAAFVSFFVPTHFINSGGRMNKGVLSQEGTFEEKGIYAGLVGARFERPGLMEWAHMILTPHQNTPEKGYGISADPTNPKTIELKIWAELYQSKMGNGFGFATYEDAKNDTSGRYLTIKNGTALFDTMVYRERLKLSLESFLLESNETAGKLGKKAYLHAVGLGLGVWMVDPIQTDIMLDVYAELLASHKLEHIADLDFSYFGDSKKCGNAGDLETFDSTSHSIRIHFSKRDPADKLKGDDVGKLLIAQYAWDSNAYPGNEYWLGALSASGDPAAACCSMIPELQNPEINPMAQAKYLVLRG